MAAHLGLILSCLAPLASESGCTPDATILWTNRQSGCPQVPWQMVAASDPDVISRYRNPVLVNVGANKGYAAAEFLAIWSQRSVNPKLWHERILEYAHERNFGFLKYQPCGVCNACRLRTPARHQRSGGSVRMLELLESNRELLRHLINSTGIGDIAKVHDLAASNVTHSVHAPRGYAGMEFLAVQEGTNKKQPNLEAVALDDLFAREGLGEAYLVSIDTEGSDALVLEGMQRLLRQGAVGFLEFEVGANKGYWREDHPERRHLGTTISRLLAFGYFCFFEAGHQLAPISGQCWSDTLAFPPWANVLCAKDGTPALRVLWQVASAGSRAGKM